MLERAILLILYLAVKRQTNVVIQAKGSLCPGQTVIRTVQVMQ